MKLPILAVLALATLSAAAEPLDIARVDVNRIQQRFDYRSLASLNGSERMRIALKDINRKIEALQTDLMEATDNDSLNEIQQMLQFYQNKRNLLLNTLSNSSSDWQKNLGRFVKERYAESYPLILIANSNSITQYAIHSNIREVDITDEIIEVIEEELGM